MSRNMKRVKCWRPHMRNKQKGLTNTHMAITTDTRHFFAFEWKIKMKRTVNFCLPRFFVRDAFLCVGGAVMFTTQQKAKMNDGKRRSISFFNALWFAKLLPFIRFTSLARSLFCFDSLALLFSTLGHHLTHHQSISFLLTQMIRWGLLCFSRSAIFYLISQCFVAFFFCFELQIQYQQHSPTCCVQLTRKMFCFEFLILFIIIRLEHGKHFKGEKSCSCKLK